MDSGADVAAENFVEIAIQDARIEELYNEQTNKLQLSFFLMKLLNEFKHHEVSNAIENQAMHPDAGQVPANYAAQPEGFGSPLRKEKNRGPSPGRRQAAGMDGID